MDGADHPVVARTLGNLGNVQSERGDLAAAEASQKRALAIEETVYGPDHPEVAKTLTNLGNVQSERGDLSAAKVNLTRALAIQEKVRDPDHPRSPGASAISASCSASSASWPPLRPARSGPLRSRKRRMARITPTSPGLLINLGTVQRDIGLTAEARRSYERAAAIFTATLGEQHPHTMLARRALAELNDETGKGG